MEINSVDRIVQPLMVAAAAPVEAMPQQREVIQAVKALNATEMFGQENELQFQMDRQLRRIVVQVVNRATREVISQIPAEYLLRLAEDIRAGGK